jgi:hypothetical protein
MALAANRAPERTNRSSWPLACRSSKRPSVAITTGHKLQNRLLQVP